MEARWLNEKEVSAITGLAVQTLRNWRQTRKGFSYSKVGRSVRYSMIDVEQFMQARKVGVEG